MATGYKTCKICGKKYEYCMTNRRDTIFRWQDVACSPEHGAIYFQQIAESRKKAASSHLTEELPIDEDLDELFEEDFDDSEEDLTIEK